MFFCVVYTWNIGGYENFHVHGCMIFGACCFLSFIFTLWKTFFWDTTESRIGIRFVTCCIINLDWYVTFCYSCIIVIVSNDIIRMGSKMISCIWVVGEFSTTSAFSDPQKSKKNILDPRRKVCSLKTTQSKKVCSL